MKTDKNLIKLKIWLQFSFSIVVLFVSTLNLLFNHFLEEKVYFMLLQFVAALASNCCSVSCTMMYFSKERNDEKFIIKKLFYILGSLAIYITIFFVNVPMDNIIWYRVINIILIGVTLAIIISILIFLIKDLSNVYNMDIQDQNEISKKIKKAKKITKESVGDEEYNV